MGPDTNQPRCCNDFNQPAQTPIKTHGRSPAWASNVTHIVGVSDIEATWHVPTNHNETQEYAYSASWVGINLGNANASSVLFQAGSDTDGLNGVVVSYQLWWEAWPINNSQVLQVMSGPNDLIYVHLTIGSTGVTYHVINESETHDYHFAYTAGGHVNDGHSEWVYERYQVGGQMPIFNNAPPYFTNTEAVPSGGGWTPLGSLQHYAQNMWTCNELTELAYPGSIEPSGTAFQEHFVNPGSGDDPNSPACVNFNYN